jgi:1-deoxy-D-xylulose-5-phosphate synthase
MQTPVLVHMYTTKGKGHDPAEADNYKFHSVSAPGGSKPAAPNYDTVFGQTLCAIAETDPRVVAITAAMCGGTGLSGFAERFPERFFDVGIAEGHAVTFAAGLATQDFRPVAAIYSTFLQRAYDHLIHDVCAQNLHVVFALDRAGLVGNDGRTHQGVFDLTYLRAIPNLVVMAPKDENELRHMVFTAVNHAGPIALRYPRGSGQGVPTDEPLRALTIGQAEVLRRGAAGALLAIGATVGPCLKAADLLAARGIQVTVVNSRFVKPVDEMLLGELARQFDQLITVEENAIAGGFGSAVSEALERLGFPHVAVHRLGVPDRFIDHATQNSQRRSVGLDAEGIAEAVGSRLRAPQHVPAGGG